MLRRFSKKNKNPSDGASSSSANDNERKYKKLLKKFLDFITSPVWSIPIASFIEGQSVVFDRVQMETEIYQEIHREYSQLIDTLIECFCEDVGTTSSELIEAIKTIDQQDISQQYKVALEPLLAAQNYNVFVPMMMRKNIELQLQALQMIEFMCGLIPSVLQLEDGESLKNMKKLTPEQTERYVLISVLRHSKDEYDAMQKGTEELEQVARNSRIQREALEREIQKEEVLLQRALEEGRAKNQMGSSSSTQTDGAPGTSSLRSVAAIMAATFSIDTATSTDDVKIQLLDSGTMTSSGVSSGTMTSSTGVDAGTDPSTDATAESRGSRPKSAKRVGSAVGKRSGSAADPDSEGARPRTSSKKTSATDSEERRPRTSSKKTSEANSEEKRPMTSSKKTSSSVMDSEANTDERRPRTSSKKTTTASTMDSEVNTEGKQTSDSGANTDAIRKTSQSTEMSPELKRPGTAKGPNERKYSNAGLEDLVGVKNGGGALGTEEPKSEPKSRPSTRKSSRDKKPTTSHEPRAKTPLQNDRPATRRSSVDKNAPKRNDSVPRERKHSVSQDERKPPKPIGPLKNNKLDGEVFMGRPGSPGRDHGPRRKNLNDVNSHLVDVNRLSSSDVRTRAQYLKEQRDKLLEMKNAERIKQMNDIQNSGGIERPKTAARAREVLDKDKKAAEEIRKEISKKLKTQILTLN